MTSPYIQQISEKYKVHVSYKTRSRLHATLVIVKGCEWEMESVKHATLLLINHMCGKVAVGIARFSTAIGRQQSDGCPHFRVKFRCK